MFGVQIGFFFKQTTQAGLKAVLNQSVICGLHLAFIFLIS